MSRLHASVLMTASIGLGALLWSSVPAFAAASGTTGSAPMTMEATAYGPSLQDNYPYGATDYFGQPLTTGDIAVDPSVIPLRTCVLVSGYHSPNLPTGGFIGEADDEGNAIQGMHIDVYLDVSENQVNNFGIQTVQVKELGPAGSRSLSGTAACSSYAHGGDNLGPKRPVTPLRISKTLSAHTTPLTHQVSIALAAERHGLRG